MNAFESILFSIAAMAGFLFILNSFFANKLFSKNFSELQFKKRSTKEMRHARYILSGIFILLFMVYAFGSMKISQQFEEYSASYISLNLLLIAFYLFCISKATALFNKKIDMEAIMVEEKVPKKIKSEFTAGRGLNRNISWWVVIVVLAILILLPAIIGAIYSDLMG